MLSVWLRRDASRYIRREWWMDTAFQPCRTIPRRYSLEGGVHPDMVRKEDLGRVPWEHIERWEWIEHIYKNFQPVGYYRENGERILIRNIPGTENGVPMQTIAIHASTFEGLRQTYLLVRRGLDPVH